MQKHKNSSRLPQIATTIVTIVMLLIGGIAFTGGTASAQDATENKGCPTGVTVPDGMHCEADGNGGFTVVVDSNDACANITVPQGYKCENGNVVVDNGSGTGGSGNGGTNSGFFTPEGYCTLGASSDRKALAWDGKTRVWMADSVATDIKEIGGVCSVTFPRRVVFTYNSVEGQILVDGQNVPNGNGMLTAGSKFEVKYAADNGSNGFDLWVDLAADPNSVNTGAGTPDPTAVASATCTGGGKSWTLAYDANKGVLYMDDFIAEARTVNKTNDIICTLTTTVDGIVKINGGNVTFPAGSTTYTFPAGTPENEFGFSWEKTTA